MSNYYVPPGKPGTYVTLSVEKTVEKINDLIDKVWACAPGTTRYQVPEFDELQADISADILALAGGESQPEPVMWQSRWTNPGDYPNQAPEQLEWKEIKPYMLGQTLAQRIEELRAFRYQDKAAYEVRALCVLGAPDSGEME